VRARVTYQPAPLPKSDPALLVTALEEQLQGLAYALQGVDRDKATLVTTPATATSAGLPGQLAYDSDYIYVCTATDTWKRAALSTW
jgi:hypothetical protein